jgi:hypothetical protein
MTGNATDGSNADRIKVGALLQLLNVGDLQEFWNHVGKTVFDLSHKSQPFIKLCNAVRDIKLSKSKTGPIKVLPGEARALASETLRTRVLDNKDRLLDHPSGHSFLDITYCQWLQVFLQPELCAVLDTMKCPHDGQGSITSQIFPAFSSEDAEREILALTTSHSAYSLALVCGGLIINTDKWHGLRAAFVALQEMAASSAELEPTPSLTAQEPTDKIGEAVIAPPPILAISTDALNAIRNGLVRLKQYLENAITDTSVFKVPDLKLANDCWHNILKQHTEAAKGLGVSSLYVKDLEEALALRNETALVQHKITRCRSIIHLTNADFGGVADILQKCNELEKAISEQLSIDPLDLDAVDALIELVEHAKTADEEHATELQTKVERLFSKLVANAAVRGRLSFSAAVPDLPPPLLEVTLATSTTPSEGTKKVAETLAQSSSPNPIPFDILSNTNGTRPDVTEIATSTGHLLEEEALDTDITADAVQTKSNTDVTLADGSIPSEVEGSDVIEVTLEPVDDHSDLAIEFESFTSFKDSHWVGASGSVTLAPWRAEGFFTTLAQRACEAWDQGEAGIAFLFARAVVAAGGTDPLGVDDLASADQLLSDPAAQSAGIDPNRTTRLLSYSSGSVASGGGGMGLTLMLEALRPTLPSPFDPAAIEILLTNASYDDTALNELVRYLLQAWHAEQDPLIPLRARLLDAPQDSIEDLEAALREAQSSLRAEVASLWSAAGGKLQHTHSRVAWNKFMQETVTPIRDELAPPNAKHNENIRWTADRVNDRVVKFAHSFKRIMDASEVKYQDKTVAQVAAGQIVTAIDRVFNTLQRLDVHKQRLRASYDGIPYDAARRLMSKSVSNTSEKLLFALFTAVLKSLPQPNCLRLKVGHLINHVDTITHLNSSTLSKLGVARDGVCISDFDEPIPVSVLLLGWDVPTLNAVEGDRELLMALRNAAAEHERPDILAALLPTDVLQSHEKTHLHRRALELRGEVFEATRELERIWGANNELMVDSEAKLKMIVEEAQSVESSNDNSMTSSLLFLAWLKKNSDLAVAYRDNAANSLLDLARGRSNDDASRIESYFRENDYRSGAALYFGVAPTTVIERSATRRTILREDALNRWSEPMTKLDNDLRGSTDDQGRLIDIWVTSANETGPRDSLPRLFYSVISGEAGRSINENQKRFPVKLSELREHKERKTIIKCETVRTYFQKSNKNPTFVPQLADFNHIVIVSAPQQANRSATVVDDLCKTVGNETQGALVVFLAPKLSLTRRDEICAGLRKRGVTAAIVDDTDLCRLCAVSSRASGHDFTPLLEILLEQLDLDCASPFSSLDGQHVRLETYIGRAQEAQKVALGWSYTRVFSGRKLGKSALLKYVANNFDRYELPSGNTLNIFFITIAGGESERWVVDCIIDEMAIRFGMPKRPSPKDQSPAERFSEFMRRFLQEKPGQSVLFILDEADAFVEGQLSRYDADREGSLSFRMMKELPAQVDANQLPRIRTIFSGYRVTNTRGGVWANAGDVLVLRPLAEDEAVQFLEGMLTRVGITLGNHAPFVAMRCGFQPAVLIRFGENIIKRLKKSNRSASRETLRVSHDDVLATLGEQSVLDEIKTVVNNNFQGNRIGAVIFGATLLALKDLKPGQALTQGPSQVIEKLKEIDPNLDWLERIDTSPLSEIERNLQDFIDRELLTVSDAPRFGEREYRLRFPHFLPVLTQQSEVALEVRQQIQAIRSGASQRRLSQCVLSESALDTVRFWHNLDNPQDCKLIVVGGHWTAALLDAKCGVPDRLGCDRSVISLAVDLNQIQKQITDNKLVFGNVTANSWKTFVDTKTERPLVLIGNLDLLRTAKQYALNGGSVPVEVVTLGRLTEATVAWWFEEARALHFQTGNAISRIAHATNLVPFLINVFDKLLPQTVGLEVSERELCVALKRFDESMSEWALSLCDSSLETSLTTREIELLRMAVQTTEEIMDEFDLDSDFRECWSLLSDKSLGNAPFSDAGDWASLKMLVDIGLLPTHSLADSASNAHSLGSVRFETSSALVRLIKALGQTSAT